MTPRAGDLAALGQLSVVGFDDIFGADFCHPPLTTVDLLLGTRTDVRVVLPTDLMVRDSTGPRP